MVESPDPLCVGSGATRLVIKRLRNVQTTYKITEHKTAEIDNFTKVGQILRVFIGGGLLGETVDQIMVIPN